MEIKIKDEEFEFLKKLKNSCQKAEKDAENAVLKSDLLNEKYENAVLKLHIIYKLDGVNKFIDLDTGLIKEKEEGKKND